MYSNMSTFRSYPNTYSSMPNSMTSSNMAYDTSRKNMSYSSMPYSSMPSSMSSSNQDSRIIGGGFLGPFVLGGITGGLLAPAFYRPYPYYNPYPYYGPYWR